MMLIFIPSIPLGEAQAADIKYKLDYATAGAVVIPVPGQLYQYDNGKWHRVGFPERSNRDELELSTK